MKHFQLMIAATAALLLTVSCNREPDFSKLPGTDMIDSYVSDAETAGFLKSNIPIFECPDAELQRKYYSCWSDSLPPVKWLRNPKHMRDYLYSFPKAAAIWDLYTVDRDMEIIWDVYDDLRDSCLVYDDAVALAKMARLLNKPEDERLFTDKAEELKDQQGGQPEECVSFADKVISGLVGLSADENAEIIVNPNVPDGVWDWWCLRDARIAGRYVTVVYDKTGKRYGVGKGLKTFIQDPPYVKEEIAKAAERFKEWKGDDMVVVFPILTDIHAHHRDSYRHIGYAAQGADAFGYDFMALLGDIGLNLGLSHESKKHVKDVIDATRAEMDKFDGVFLYTPGNHDWDAGEGDYHSDEFFQETFQKPALKHAGKNLHLTPGRVYCYYDVPKKHTRVILLNSCGTGTQGGTYYIFDDEQLQWLCDLLDNTPDDTDIIVFAHYMPHPIGRWHNTPAPYTKAANEKLMAILARYKAAGKQISGLYCGDSHVNTAVKEDGVNYYLTQSLGGVSPESMMDGTTHVWFDQILETCCDVVAVKPDKNEVRSFRIGAGGEDFDLAFDY